MAVVFILPRCPVYMNLPNSCRLETDPKDACCKVPVCQTEPTKPVYTSPTTQSTSAAWSSTTPKLGTTLDTHGLSSFSHGTTPSGYVSTHGGNGATTINFNNISPSSQTPPKPSPSGKTYLCYQ